MAADFRSLVTHPSGKQNGWVHSLTLLVLDKPERDRFWGYSHPLKIPLQLSLVLFHPKDPGHVKISPMSLSITLQYAGSACQGQTLLFIGSICKLWKNEVLWMRIFAQGPYSQHFIFLVTYEWDEKARVFVSGKAFPAKLLVTLGSLRCFTRIESGITRKH